MFKGPKCFVPSTAYETVVASPSECNKIRIGIFSRLVPRNESKDHGDNRQNTMRHVYTFNCSKENFRNS
jgi:hypothetical protein